MLLLRASATSAHFSLTAKAASTSVSSRARVASLPWGTAGLSANHSTRYVGKNPRLIASNPCVHSGCVQGPEMPPSSHPQHLCRAASHRRLSAGSPPAVPGPQPLGLPTLEAADPRCCRPPGLPDGRGRALWAVGPCRGRSGGHGRRRSSSAGGSGARRRPGTGRARQREPPGGKGLGLGLLWRGCGTRHRDPSRAPKLLSAEIPRFLVPAPGARRERCAPRCRAGVGVLQPPGLGWSRRKGGSYPQFPLVPSPVSFALLARSPACPARCCPRTGVCRSRVCRNPNFCGWVLLAQSRQRLHCVWVVFCEVSLVKPNLFFPNAALGY